ncbi:MAG TPA: M23 family metallopeptidase [bacterium]|nr:M23 family metallopeptidase [bacterium]
MGRARRTIGILLAGFFLVVGVAANISAAAKPQYFITPTWGTLSSHLGWRQDPFRGNTWQHHWGIDIAARYGTPVLASAAGVARFAATYAGYGPVVYIEHGRGWATLYAHLSRIDVQVGQRVEQARTIGAVGSYGRSTGPHLHFEIRYNGVPVNPLTYIGR